MRAKNAYRRPAPSSGAEAAAPGLAQAEAVPVYAIFTNEQLAEMVRSRATTKQALGKIPVVDSTLD